MARGVYIGLEPYKLKSTRFWEIDPSDERLCNLISVVWFQTLHLCSILSITIFPLEEGKDVF